MPIHLAMVKLVHTVYMYMYCMYMYMHITIEASLTKIPLISIVIEVKSRNNIYFICTCIIFMLCIGGGGCMYHDITNQ